MNVISRRKLSDFYESKPEFKRHADTFEFWFKLTRKAHWRDFSDTRALFGQTDVVRTASGRTVTVVDIGGNKYRIIALVDYGRQTVLITHVLTHAEYDKARWKQEI